MSHFKPKIMNTFFRRVCSLAVMLTMVVPHLFAQETLSLNYEGVLKDIEENTIQEDEFELIVNVLSVPDGKTLWEKTYQAKSDMEGWFGFEIEEFNSLFGTDNGSASVEVHLGFFPMPDSRWIDQGSDFLVSYTIKRHQTEDSLVFEINRMEGSVLSFSQYNDVLFFQDTYPFAYLQGGFMIAMDNTEANLSSLRDIISGVAEGKEKSARSRGLKGGFAVGGYRKNQ